MSCQRSSIPSPLAFKSRLREGRRRKSGHLFRALLDAHTARVPSINPNLLGRVAGNEKIREGRKGAPMQDTPNGVIYGAVQSGSSHSQNFHMECIYRDEAFPNFHTGSIFQGHSIWKWKGLTTHLSTSAQISKRIVQVLSKSKIFCKHKYKKHRWKN